ncbi:MAG: MmcQ/YjbR family DNA-binding protein [Egibacteraceae bacterium]
MMLDQLRAVLLSYPEAVEEEPFGPGTLVFKVGGKIFAITGDGSDESPARVSLKCEPGLALELRAMYPCVRPGYHLNKRHWNTVTLDGSVPREEVLDLIGHSYERVVAGLPKADRERLTRS